MTNYRQHLFELKNGIKPKKEESKKQSIPKRSKKLAVEMNKIYKPLVAEFLSRPENQECKIKSPVCTKQATCVNHKKRRGVNLCNEKYFDPACPPCNNYIEEHPKWAYENGHLISIHKKD